jgi:hypothetical protein
MTMHVRWPRLEGNRLKVLTAAVALASALVIPTVCSRRNVYLLNPGLDAFSHCAIAELVYRGLRKGEITTGDLVVRRSIAIRDLVWPDGFDDKFKGKVDLSLLITVLFRHVTADANAAYLTTLILFFWLNVLALFLLLRRVFRIPDPLALAFSVLAPTYPYFYYQLGHLSLISFWQELAFIYVVVRFIDRPRLLFALLVPATVFLNFLMDPQTTYYLALSVGPAFLVSLLYRLTRDAGLRGSSRRRYLGRLLLFSALALAGCALVYVDFSHRLLAHMPARESTEIGKWAAPVTALLSPPRNNILVRLFTGGIPAATPEYWEKVPYLGIAMLVSFLGLSWLVLRKLGPRPIVDRLLRYSPAKLFLLCGVVIGANAVLVAVAPSLHLGGILHRLNHSGRVYSRAISLGIVFWVMSFVVLLHRARATHALRSRTLVVLMTSLIVLDTWPSTLESLAHRPEAYPPEYRALVSRSRPGQVVLDYFGRSCIPWGFIHYKTLHELRDFNFDKVQKKWGAELMADLRRHKVDYILFCKRSEELHLDPPKIDKLVAQFALEKLFESDRGLLVRIPPADSGGRRAL